MDYKTTENTDNGENLINALNETLINLHLHPFPQVPNPPECKKRASVALIIRIRPRYENWPEADSPRLDKSISISQQVDEFFSQDWVQHGDPEVLFIKRASRKGDRWTGHVALPGGKRDPEDEDDLAAAIRETSEEVGLDLTADDYISVANLPERVVTTSWDSIPLMVLCPFIFLSTSSESPALRLQPTEIASTHWVSLRALLSPSLRTVERVDLSERYAKQGSLASRLAQRWMAGFMEFSAIHLIPTESLFCSFISGFVPGSLDSPPPSLLRQWKQRILRKQASSTDGRRPLLLWGLTLGILADFLDMLPPHNAVKLWKYPTFTAPDLRLIVSLLTYNLRKQNENQVRSPRRPSQTALDAQTAAVAVTDVVDREHDPNAAELGDVGIFRCSDPSPSTRGRPDYAVGIMLRGYYRRLRMAMYVFALWRLATGSVAALWLLKWLRRR